MADKVRVIKEFDFEAAHALDGYEGKCKDIHGHSYHMTIVVLGEPIQDPGNSSCGMVMDFSDLKFLVQKNVLDIFDHFLILRKDSRFKGLESKNQRIRYVDYQPTCENMLLEIVSLIQNDLKDGLKLVKATLRETRNSYAEWHAADN
ncbi:MAG: 6-carboxytetrahydropterin synthase [Flavobacteriales bacterium]|nr:6-carboxytetrahydropterin synthase [Flavobacteriales bacterium]